MSSDERTVPLWQTVELRFEGERAYDKPFGEVELEACFRHDDGTEIIRPAYWDGGTSWGIRFAPPSSGDWHYTVRSNQPDDGGFQRDGVVRTSCVDAARGAIRRGFIRPSSDGHNLEHLDGTPFFWLGDTHWRFRFEDFDTANKPDWPSWFRGIVDRRVDQGFTVYQANLMAFDWGSATSPYSVGESFFEEPDVTFFQEVIDPRLGYIAASGLVLALGLAWHHAIDDNVDGMRRFARYVVARYGSYPLVWTLGGEVAGYETSIREQRIDGWREVALEIAQADGYGHPITAHLTNERPIAEYYQGEPWLGFTLHQHGHGDLDLDTTHYAKHLQRHPHTPLVEGESLYEGLLSVERAGRRTVTDTMVRQVAWRALQSGCCGYTYGAQGCWNGARDEHDSRSMWGSLPWYEGVDLPGATQLTHLRAFYETVPWTELRPSNALFRARNEFNGTICRADVSATPDRTAVVLYLGEVFRRHEGSGQLVDMPARQYFCHWYDPRTGSFASAGEPVTPSTGLIDVPDRPDDRDWILLVDTIDRSGTEGRLSETQH